ncbi:MAG: GNAT family N-acetyltransferase [Planctomycetaceae bacterium]|nr:GNAT family N-acetyltransferase [Planctomycetaceae bacterium]
MLLEPSAEDVWLVSEKDGQPVGVAYFAPEKMTRGTWNLYFIAVLPGSQKKGVGATMVEHIAGMLSERGERLLLVETAGLDDFDYVRRFYQSHEFVPTAMIPNFYDDGVDKVIFTRSLT